MNELTPNPAQPRTITELKSMVDKTNIKSKDAAILLIYAIENGLNPNCVLVTESDVKKLRKEGIIYLDNKNNIRIRYTNTENTLSEIDERLEEYRGLWRGLFTGSMGSSESCKVKLEAWLQDNSNYTMEDVIRAAKFWINNKKKEVDNPSLIGQADYFIYKKVDGVLQSRLSSVVDEAGEAGDIDVFSTLI